MNHPKNMQLARPRTSVPAVEATGPVRRRTLDLGSEGQSFIFIDKSVSTSRTTVRSGLYERTRTPPTRILRDSDIPNIEALALLRRLRHQEMTPLSISPKADKTKAPANELPAKKKPANKTTSKKAPATKTPRQKAPANKPAAKKAPANKTSDAPDNETPPKKSLANKTIAKKAPEDKIPAKKAPANKTEAKKAPAKKTFAKKATCSKNKQ